jgi:hypothetical protein
MKPSIFHLKEPPVFGNLIDKRDRMFRVRPVRSTKALKIDKVARRLAFHLHTGYMNSQDFLRNRVLIPELLRNHFSVRIDNKEHLAGCSKEVCIIHGEISLWLMDLL